MPRRLVLLLLVLSAVSLPLICMPSSAQVTFALTSLSPASNSNGNGDSVVPGDFNNDGILDLVTINYSSLTFYKGLGGGKYAAGVQQSLPRQTAGAFSPAFAADFNSDGKLDIATAWGGTCYLCTSGPVFILLGNGDGSFTVGQSINVSGNAATIALADFNGDHKPDILVSDNVYNHTWIYLGNGDGTFTLSDTQPYGAYALAVGDFNADGKQDVVLSPSSGASELALFLGNGDGTLAAPVFTSICCSVVSLAVGDFYNNRIQSVAALMMDPYSSDEYIYALQYRNGALVMGTPVSLGKAGSQAPEYLAAGDLNGDFVSDLFVSGANPAYSEFLLGNGNGTFGSPQMTPNNGSFSLIYPIIRDLNLDSRNDVVMAWISEAPSGGAEQLLNRNGAVNCVPPRATKLSVNVCGLKGGQIVPATFTFKAAGNAFSGVVKRMELWIDNNKVGQNLEDQLNVTATLAAGSHKASFVAVDTFDNYVWASVKFTTQ